MNRARQLGVNAIIRNTQTTFRFNGFAQILILVKRN